MDKHRWIRSVVVCLLVAAAHALAQPAPGGREITALVGAGQDTVTLNAYFPDTLVVRQGDTVTWRVNSDEIHTVSFVEGVPADQLTFAIGGPDGPVLNPMIAFPTRAPGGAVESYGGTGLASSGIMSRAPSGPDAPPNDTFSLTFDTPGTYKYYCLVHEEFMSGTVVVRPADAADVPSQEEVTAQAEAQIEPLLAGLETVRQAAEQARTEPGPGGTEVVFVKAGVLDILTADPRAELMEFLPKNVTVRAGDTVVWGSTGFHTVTFDPLPPQPEFIVPQPQEDGPPLLLLNLEALTPAKPSGVYDPLAFFNSGDIGFFSMNGASWALTFDEPGVYEYVCLIHSPVGMEGTVTVLPR